MCATSHQSSRSLEILRNAYTSFINLRQPDHRIHIVFVFYAFFKYPDGGVMITCLLSNIAIETFQRMIAFNVSIVTEIIPCFSAATFEPISIPQARLNAVIKNFTMLFSTSVSRQLHGITRGFRGISIAQVGTHNLTHRLTETMPLHVQRVMDTLSRL